MSTLFDGESFGAETVLSFKLTAHVALVVKAKSISQLS